MFILFTLQLLFIVALFPYEAVYFLHFPDAYIWQGFYLLDEFLVFISQFLQILTFFFFLVGDHSANFLWLSWEQYEKSDTALLVASFSRYTANSVHKL